MSGRIAGGGEGGGVICNVRMTDAVVIDCVCVFPLRSEGLASPGNTR